MGRQFVTEVQDLIGEAATRFGPAVVGLGRGWGSGSGVVVAPGRVLTAAHNLRGEELGVTFLDGRRADGRVSAVDRDLDVAVVAADTQDVEPVAWIEPFAAPGIGTAVLALASPGGRGLRVTFGFVASARRSFRGPRGRRINGAIEHTAPLPRGSSGGPLLDTDGRLLGLNAVRVDSGLILAIPADDPLRARAAELGRGEAPQRARLGVAVAPPRVARRLRAAVGLPPRDGVLVREVEDDGPAARAGIERGDLLVAAGATPLDRVEALYEVLDAATVGAPLEVTVVRGVEERALTVELGR